ncbi:MAG: hypothetical protein CM1200mP2_49230 [Planctomycetaceae bacterium]|nr:MAG: hypothetical protein CM1200mP2_49230 [Planctomycetaceae bacterium]
MGGNPVRSYATRRTRVSRSASGGISQRLGFKCLQQERVDRIGDPCSQVWFRHTRHRRFLRCAECPEVAILLADQSIGCGTGHVDNDFHLGGSGSNPATDCLEFTGLDGPDPKIDEKFRWRHVAVVDLLDQQAGIGFSRNDGRSGFAALEHCPTGSQVEPSLFFPAAVADHAAGEQDRQHILLGQGRFGVEVSAAGPGTVTDPRGDPVHLRLGGPVLSIWRHAALGKHLDQQALLGLSRNHHRTGFTAPADAAQAAQIERTLGLAAGMAAATAGHQQRPNIGFVDHRRGRGRRQWSGVAGGSQQAGGQGHDRDEVRESPHAVSARERVRAGSGKTPDHNQPSD